VFPVSGTRTTGLIGSSVVTVRLHDFGPAEVGANLTVRSMPESGLIGTGNVGGLTSVKSAHVGTALIRLRLHPPTLFTLIVCAGVVPPHVAVPKSPLPVTTIVPDAVVQVTVTSLRGVTESLLAIVNVADFAPNVVGVQLNEKLKLASGLTFTGKVGPVANVMSVLPEVRVILLMSRLSAAVFDTSSSAEPVEPLQTLPISSGFGLMLICGSAEILKKIASLLAIGFPSAAPLPVKTP